MKKAPAKAKGDKVAIHPSYPNPAIAEALCELHFALPDGESWTAALAGQLFRKVQDDYPSMEAGLDIGVKLEVGPQGYGQAIVPEGQVVRFRHRNRPLLLQLRPNILTVNLLPTYPGWEVMRQDVLHAWRAARESLRPIRITRVGLRYINKIPRGAVEVLADWFRQSPYVPAGVLVSQGGFFSRAEAQIDRGNRVIVTLAETEEGADKWVFFDIDRVTEEMIAVDESVLVARMDELHEDIWNIFVTSRNRRLEEHLKGARR